MARPVYDDATKQHAVKLGVALGKAEAARRTGIKPGTIGAWMSRAGVVTSCQVKAGIQNASKMHQATLEERRLRLGQELLALAEHSVATARARIDKANLRDLVGAYDYAIKNSNLLTGAATSRTETLVGKDAASTTLDELKQRRQETAA